MAVLQQSIPTKAPTASANDSDDAVTFAGVMAVAEMMAAAKMTVVAEAMIVDEIVTFI